MRRYSWVICIINSICVIRACVRGHASLSACVPACVHAQPCVISCMSSPSTHVCPLSHFRHHQLYFLPSTSSFFNLLSSLLALLVLSSPYPPLVPSPLSPFPSPLSPLPSPSPSTFSNVLLQQDDASTEWMGLKWMKHVSFKHDIKYVWSGGDKKGGKRRRGGEEEEGGGAVRGGERREGAEKGNVGL